MGLHVAEGFVKASASVENHDHVSMRQGSLVGKTSFNSLSGSSQNTNK